MTIQQVVDILAKILAAYALVLIIAAILLNPIVCYVCLKSAKLRHTSTFKLLAFASINDMLTCLVWNEGDFAHTLFGVTWSKYSPFYCMWISIFFQYTTLQIASWMLVTISFDRLMSLSLNVWTRYCFNGIKPFVFSTILVLFIVGVNINEGFTTGYFMNKNGTQVFVCYSNPHGSFPWYDIMSQILVYFGEFLPFSLLIVFNIMIIFKANQYNHVQSSVQRSASIINSASGCNRGLKRKAQMTRMILFITFLYIVISLPSTLLSGYFYPKVVSIPQGALIVNLVNAVQFSFPAFNFFILYFSNKMFAREIKAFFLRKSDKNNSMSSFNTTIKTLNSSRGSRWAFRFFSK